MSTTVPSGNTDPIDELTQSFGAPAVCWPPELDYSELGDLYHANRLDVVDEEAYELPSPPETGRSALPSVLYERWEDGVRMWRFEDAYPALGYAIYRSGSHRMAVSESDLGDYLEVDSRWSTMNPLHYHGRGLGPRCDGGWPIRHGVPDYNTDETWERQYAPIERVIAPRNAGDLTFEYLSGRHSQTFAKTLLDNEDVLSFPSNPEFQGWRIGVAIRGPAYGAPGNDDRHAYDRKWNRDERVGDLLGVAVVGNPCRADDDGHTLAVTNLTFHETAPKNSGSRIFRGIRQWMLDNGWDRLKAIAGKGGNDGTQYRAAGMQLRIEVPDEDSSRWNNREGRNPIEGTWHKRSYVQYLTDEAEARYTDSNEPEEIPA